HEHRLAIYEEFGVNGGIRAFGRCIGHGGMPIDLPPVNALHPECPVEFVDARPYPNDENLVVGFNGFARLTLQGALLKVQYVDLQGTEVFSETWSSDRGNLTRIGKG